MPTIKRFEDLHAWQAARNLVKLIYRVTADPPFNRDFGLRDQIRRASVSVMSNIAEGFGSGSDGEFIKFLSYSRRSICETQSQAYVALDLQYMDKSDFDQIYQTANEIERQVNHLLSYLARCKKQYSTGEELGLYALELPST